MYAAYKMWCEDNEHPKASKHVFGRDLRAAVPVYARCGRATEASAVTSMLASHCRTPRKDRKPKTGSWPVLAPSWQQPSTVLAKTQL